jgi:2-phospho-L-lactate guanylyltransferase
MAERPLVVIPVKSFATAKSRLMPSMTDAQRSSLGSALALRTAWVARDSGGDVIVVAGSDNVRAWANRAGFDAVTQQPSHPLLDGAARLGAEIADRRRQRGFILHSDLPWLDAPVLRGALGSSGIVIAPSHDGGTALLGGVGPGFPFAYGTGSFHRHLAAAASCASTVVIGPGLAFDLDRPGDLRRATIPAVGSWLRRYFPRDDIAA